MKIVNDLTGISGVSITDRTKTISSMKYRPDIDGLRAIAVLPVIFFHAGFQGSSGGYVGVDVFFVISGYLITSIILHEQERGVFVLSKFYERRARRILPALYLVLLCTLPFGWYWLSPLQFKDFSQSIAATTLFSSNFLFWLESGYFAPDASLKPLLHTWSLAVEEQYYIVFPALMILAWRVGRRVLAGSVALVVMASLLVAQGVFLDDERANFFLAPSRVWELGLGVLCALYLFGRAPRSSSVAELMCLGGLAAIAWSVLSFDADTPFPGFYALLPTIGTAAIIVYSQPGMLAYRILAFRPLVMVGLLSYSAYLWHLPLFAFARIREGEELSAAEHVPLIALTFLLSYASWRIVETPLRRKSFISSRMVLALMAFFSVGFVAVGVFGHLTNGADYRFAAVEQAALAYEEYPTDELYRQGRCFLAPGETELDFESECEESSKFNRRMVVWGDSHAAALHMGLFELFKQWDRTQYTISGCPPIRKYDTEKREHCSRVNDWIFGQVESYEAPVVLMHANWKDHVDRDDFKRSLRQTIQDLQQTNARVNIIGGVPQWDESLPVQYVKRHNKKLGADGRVVMVESQRLAELRAADEMVKGLVEPLGASFHSVLDQVCDAGYCDAAITDRNGSPILFTWDRAHLTYEGSVRVAGAIKELVAQARVDRADPPTGTSR